MRDARDERLPLRHRISHLRSCANHMADKHHVPRSVILEQIGIKDQYGAGDLPSAPAVLHAAALLDRIKHKGLHGG
jgi:hypothetical protein